MSNSENKIFEGLESLVLQAIKETPTEEGSFSLDEASLENILNTLKIRKNWVKNNLENPEHWPLKLGFDNAGVFFEALSDSSED